MISFKHHLEEFRSNVPQVNHVSKDLLIEWLNDSVQLRLAIGIFSDGVNSEKSIVVFEYNGFGAKDKFIILVDRKDRTDIVGYVWLNNDLSNGKYWQVKDVTIFKQYQGKGVGTNIYLKLAKEGYNLMNGYSLSSEVEKIWRKLPEYVNVYTWDKETDTLSVMDERPKEDNVWDDHQRYFWVAMLRDENLKESMWHSLEDEWFNKFLLGEISPGFGVAWDKGDF